MKIYNMTNRIQEVPIIDRSSGRELSIFILGNSSTEIDDILMNHRIQSLVEKKILRIGNSLRVSEAPVEEPSNESPVSPLETGDSKEVPEEEDSTQEAQKNTEEGGVESLEIASEGPKTAPVADSVVCEICGAEFASARGLSLHHAKAHSSVE